ncbi:hypothetical protein JOF35_008518 [Streptomyces demainii]|uniref:Uncharacterized protein n=1 Tax=Streptomyces demainii TaxID=588122 RepID=A0ABT9L650_9ACTN|nr:hypothetical protein [Streptomyces demainii]
MVRVGERRAHAPRYLSVSPAVRDFTPAAERSPQLATEDCAPMAEITRTLRFPCCAGVADELVRAG